MNTIAFESGYSRAVYVPRARMIKVWHSVFSSNTEIGTAARECNYRAGNWGKTKVTRGITLPPVRGRQLTYYYVETV